MLSVSDIDDAKVRVVRLVQGPLHSLLNSPLMEQHSPYVDDSGVTRVGGRLSRMSDSIQFKNPVILPKNSPFSTLVIWHSHLLTGHGGKGLYTQSCSTVWIFHYKRCDSCEILNF